MISDVYFVCSVNLCELEREPPASHLGKSNDESLQIGLFGPLAVLPAPRDRRGHRANRAEFKLAAPHIAFRFDGRHGRGARNGEGDRA